MEHHEGTGRLVEMSRAECLDLLASRPFGMLVWHGADGLTAVPVNHVVAGDTLRLRTTAYSAIARECDDSDVAFEVDLIDPQTRAGWSILVRGRADIDYGHHRDEAPEVWPEGVRTLVLTVTIATVTGRRLV